MRGEGTCHPPPPPPSNYIHMVGGGGGWEMKYMWRTHHYIKFSHLNTYTCAQEKMNQVDLANIFHAGSGWFKQKPGEFKAFFLSLE